MLNTQVRTGNTNSSQNVTIYDSAIISHIVKGSFFIDFEWGSRISDGLMGDDPRYRGEKVEVIQMRTMLNRVVAELVYKEGE